MLEQVHPEVLPNADAIAGNLAEDTGSFILAIFLRDWWLIAGRLYEVMSR
jgi:hypothetical protein